MKVYHRLRDAESAIAERNQKKRKFYVITLTGGGGYQIIKVKRKKAKQKS